MFAPVLGCKSTLRVLKAVRAWQSGLAECTDPASFTWCPAVSNRVVPISASLVTAVASKHKGVQTRDRIVNCELFIAKYVLDGTHTEVLLVVSD